MTNEPSDQPTDHSDLHDMGGAIGPASMRAQGEPAEGRRVDDEAAPASGFSEPVEPATGTSTGDSPISGSDRSGDVTTTLNAGTSTKSAYVGLPDPAGSDAVGRGADGDSEARLEQKRQGGP